MTEPTTADYEASIKASLSTITRHWDALLAMATPSGARAGGPKGALITADDHDPTDADMDRATRVVSLRRFATDVLNGWSRVVMEDRPVTKALPDGHSVPSMAAFLQVHAQWLSGHEAADVCASELKELAAQLPARTDPPRKEWHRLGDCPFVVEDRFCSGRVRVRIGGDEQTAACSRCEQAGPVQWWEEVLGIRPIERIVGAVDLARILHDRLHITVTERTVRNWAREGRITPHTPFGPQPKTPRWWFNPRDVLDEVARMDRQCPMCGRVWSGQGDVCSRCYGAMQSARPRQRSEHRHTPAARSLTGWCPWPRNVVPDSHDTDRPERCHWSDLPLDQCACGREHAAS